MTDPEPSSNEVSTNPQAAVSLRPDRPRVMQLSKKAIAVASASGLAVIGGVLIYALQPADRTAPAELYDTAGVTVADRLAGAPKDYTQVPKIGPALPGDLGRPILEAQRRGDIAALPPVGPVPPTVPRPAGNAVQAALQRSAQDREAARGSRVFFANGSSRDSSIDLRMAAQPTEIIAQAAQPPGPTTEADRRQAFLQRASDRRIQSGERLTPAASAHVLQAGAVIPAALITGIRSDIPGLVTAQVTQNVYDTVTGRNLLIPQGARLIGDYDADVAFGQKRVLLAWNRLILPDGRSIVLERQPASDPSGFAGLQDGTDFHWGGVVKAALISTLLGVGSETGSSGEGDLVRAIRRGGQDSVTRAGDQIVSRELNVRPTLTIRPGFPVRVLVTRDLDLGSLP